MAYKSFIVGKPKQELNLHPDSHEQREIEPSMLLPCLLAPASFLSYTVQDSLPGNDATHNGLGLPTSINNQDGSLQTCPQANLVRMMPH